MDEATLKRLMTHDAEAFKQLYDEHKTAIYRTCFYIVFDKQLAQDLLQETFVQAYRHIHQLQKPDALKAWLTSIAIRQSRRLVQKEKKHTWVEWQEHLEVTAHDQHTPEDQLILNEQRTALLSALVSLSLEARTILTLFYYNQLKIKEIAEIMEQPAGTIKWKLHQARKQLLERMQAEEAFTIVKEVNL